MTITAASPPLFHRNEIPAVFQEPFIVNGYRKPNCTYGECFKYIFVMHNDVGNFWTHFVPFLIWAVWLFWLSHQIDLSDPYFYPLVCFWVGACSYALLSTLAHFFASKSFTIRSVAFMVDYLGISMYAFGGGLSSFFYQPPANNVWFDYKWPVLTVMVFCSVNATLMCSLSRFFCLKERFVIRALAFTLSFFVNVSPFLHRVKVCMDTGQDCVYETLYSHFLGFFITGLIAFFFVTKIPERFVMGKFDYIGQSHQLFHLSAASLTSLQMCMLPTDAVVRRQALTQIRNMYPDFNSTFLLYIIVQGLGMMIVAVCGILVVKRILISNNEEVRKATIRQDMGKSS